MILEHGDMWSIFGNTDLFLITTNPIVRKDGACVMGAGIAKQAAQRYPQMPYDLGKVIRSSDYDGGCDVLGSYDGQPVGYFMVKSHWRDQACPEIIRYSTEFLCSMADKYDRIDLNFPGIGNGRLREEDVMPIIRVLPDHVHVWTFE